MRGRKCWELCLIRQGACEGEIRILNKPSRVEALGKNIDEVLQVGRISSKEVPKLFGRLHFAEQQIAGRVGKLALAELRSLESSK